MPHSQSIRKRKADGTELEVLVNSDFQVTAVNTMGGAHPEVSPSRA